MTNITPNDTQTATFVEAGAEVGEAYAQINRETATILNGDDGIVFTPAPDFEYTAPLEDFKQSLAQDVR